MRLQRFLVIAVEKPIREKLLETMHPKNGAKNPQRVCALSDLYLR